MQIIYDKLTTDLQQFRQAELLHIQPLKISWRWAGYLPALLFHTVSPVYAQTCMDCFKHPAIKNRFAMDRMLTATTHSYGQRSECPDLSERLHWHNCCFGEICTGTAQILFFFPRQPSGNGDITDLRCTVRHKYTQCIPWFFIDSAVKSHPIHI